MPITALHAQGDRTGTNCSPEHTLTHGLHQALPLTPDPLPADLEGRGQPAFAHVYETRAWHAPHHIIITEIVMIVITH